MGAGTPRSATRACELASSTGARASRLRARAEPHADDPRFWTGSARLERLAASPGTIADLRADRRVRRARRAAVDPGADARAAPPRRPVHRASSTRATSPSTSRAPSSSSSRAPTTCSSSGDTDADRSTRSRSSSPARATAREPDRVLATVLFTDIVGSTERAAELGDRAGATCSSATTSSSGARSTASAAARSRRRATASWPPSTARRARSAAPARSRDAVGALGLEIRAGLHTGECEVMGDDVGGIAVHIARARDGARPSRRGARVEHGEGPRGGLGDRLRGPRRARAEGVPGEWRLFMT